jgi:hypothetical protein
MLAEYVTWHLKEAWRSMLFADEDQAAKQGRDPVAPAQRSLAAEQKVGDRLADDGHPLHSFQTLLGELAGIVRNTCRTPGSTGANSSFQMTTTPNPVQQKALDRVAQIKV